MRKTEAMSIRLSPDERRMLKEAAERDNRSMAGYVLHLVKTDAAKSEKKPAKGG